MSYSLQNIFAVTVIYKTTYNSSKTLISLNNSAASINQKLTILLYNNSPNFPQPDLTYTHLECIIIADNTNPGVSKAYNTAAELAYKKGKQLLLLTDQDTYFPNHALMSYLDAVNLYTNHKLFCPVLKSSGRIYSPHKYHFRRGAHWDDVTPGVYSLANKAALNSGILVELNAFLQVGGYNNKIELYFSDFDFINKFRRANKEFVVLKIYCNHSLSDLDNIDYSSALKRFENYVKGSYYSISSVTDRIYLFITIGLRAMKLSYKYKKIGLICVFLKTYLLKKNV